MTATLFHPHTKRSCRLEGIAYCLLLVLYNTSVIVQVKNRGYAATSEDHTSQDDIVEHITIVFVIKLIFISPLHIIHISTPGTGSAV